MTSKTKIVVPKTCLDCSHVSPSPSYSMDDCGHPEAGRSMGRVGRMEIPPRECPLRSPDVMFAARNKETGEWWELEEHQWRPGWGEYCPTAGIIDGVDILEDAIVPEDDGEYELVKFVQEEELLKVMKERDLALEACADAMNVKAPGPRFTDCWDIENNP